MSVPEVRLAVIGGSGIYEISELENVEMIHIETKYGKPSDEICIGEFAGRRIAFLPRHGRSHKIPPHRIPYKANMAALAQLGVRHVLGTCVCGSLKRSLAPGYFVIPDQYINLTWGRDDTFDLDQSFVHLPISDPYCPRINKEMSEILRDAGEPYSNTGTVVVVQGPRFSTRAESRWFAAQGWDIVNMTQYPECYFARELGLCYSVLASVTDFDVSICSEWNIHPRNQDSIDALFWRNATKQKRLALTWASKALVQECQCITADLRPYFSRRNEDRSR